MVVEAAPDAQMPFICGWRRVSSAGSIGWKMAVGMVVVVVGVVGIFGWMCG